MRQVDGQAPERDDIVIGRGPVRELFKSGRPVECLFLQQGLERQLAAYAALAREMGAPVKQVAVQKLDSLCAGGNHQGVVAQTAAATYHELEDLFARAGDDPVFLLIADEIEDPHNLGALIRTAEAAGAHGLVIPKRRSAGLSFTVAKTSAGASEHLPVVRVANLPTLIEQLKARGVWVYGADMRGEPWCGADLTGPVALVVGAEGRGLGRLVRERCDALLSLPMNGEINSLNASVAGGILLYEIARQRMGLRARQPGAR